MNHEVGPSEYTLLTGNSLLTAFDICQLPSSKFIQGVLYQYCMLLIFKQLMVLAFCI